MHFRHTVDAPDQGLLLLCMFSEIASHGGGTLVAEGSHRSVARFLRTHSDGIAYKRAMKGFPSSHPWFQDLTQVARADVLVGKPRPACVSRLKSPTALAHFMGRSAT